MDNWEYRIIRSTTDSHTCSNPEKVQVIHIELELNVDFPKKVLTGNAILTLQRIQINPPINEITLDILGLHISSITNASDRIPLSYEIGSNNFGCSLRIVLQGSQDIDRIRIEYETFSSEYFPEYISPALLWLTPPQTADQTYPFLLSDNKLIGALEHGFPARTHRLSNLDTPLGQNINRDSPVLDVFEFDQSYPVPSYAVVIAVGLLPLERSYERVFIYAEKYNPYFGRFLLATIEEMLRTAAVFCGPYLWEKYVICVLPPSIAHLEIECPCLTFIPRTILGAERSYISKYLARNIAQSWAGNLVTCLSWEHLWLNKSFSTFISRKIICQFAEFGSMSDFLQQKGLRNLNKMIQRNDGLIRCLVPDMATWSPHTVTKYVPYEWGCKLLDYLQNMLGGPRVFEQFLRAYFDHFALQSINTQNWIDYLSEKFPDHMEMLSGRLYSYLTEIPSISGDLPNRSPLEQHCDEIANRWIEWNCDAYPDIPDSLRHPPSELTVGSDLYEVQKIIFFKSLHSSHTRLTIKKLRYLRNFFFDGHILNAQLRYFWLLLCIKVQWDNKVAVALNFAIENCSPNYACPIFQHLCEWSAIKREIAVKRYRDNKKKMLVQTWKSLQEILHRIEYPIPRQN